MASNIKYLSIDATFPVAGIDNDSNGFRTNFSGIKTALQTASAEITALQESAVLTKNLETGASVDNDLNGSIINNGAFHNFFGTAKYVIADSGNTPIDISLASTYICTVKVNTAFEIINWPDIAASAKARLHFRNYASVPKTIDITSSSKDIHLKQGNSFPITLTNSSVSVSIVSCTHTYFVLENEVAALKENSPIIFSDVVGGVESNTIYYVKNIETQGNNMVFSISSTIVNGVAGDIYGLAPSGNNMMGACYVYRDYVFDVWSPNNGATIYVDYVGIF